MTKLDIWTIILIGLKLLMRKTIVFTRTYKGCCKILIFNMERVASLKTEISKKFLYRCYEDFAILYDRKENVYVILEDIYADMFSIMMNVDDSSEYVITRVMEIYEIDRETACNDFEEFMCELDHILVASSASHQANVDIDNYDETENYIFDLMAERRIPFTANIEITDRCNLKCKHCYRSQNSLTLWDVKNFENTLIKLKEMGTLHIVFAGSEPLMHPNIVEFIELIAKHGFVLTLQSNVTLLNDRILVALKKCTVKMIFVSLYTDKPELHDMITSSCGSFDKTVNAIKMLQNNGFVVRASISIFDVNKDEVYAVDSLCKELGVQAGYNFKIIPAIESGKDTVSMNSFNEKQMLEYITSPTLKLYEGEIRRSRLKEGIVPVHYCTTGFRSITITYDMKVVICNAFRKVCGALKDSDLVDIWNDSTELNDWREVKSKVNKKCLTCDAYQYCEPCPAHSYTSTGDDTKIDDNTCTYGIMFKKVCDMAKVF